jgi:hypothetical protein
MYEDQRSTILAVDNLNGANVLDRTLRVDHVKKYKQARVKGEDGEWQEREEQSLNAKPEMIGEHPALPHFLTRLYTFSRRWRLGIVRIVRSQYRSRRSYARLLTGEMAGRTSEEEREENQIE